MRLPDSMLAGLLYDATNWFTEHAHRLGAPQRSCALNLFDRLADLVFARGAEATTSGIGDMIGNDHVQSRHTREHALNSFVGHLLRGVIEMIDSSELAAGAGIPGISPSALSGCYGRRVTVPTTRPANSASGCVGCFIWIRHGPEARSFRCSLTDTSYPRQRGTACLTILNCRHPRSSSCSRGIFSRCSGGPRSGLGGMMPRTLDWVIGSSWLAIRTFAIGDMLRTRKPVQPCGNSMIAAALRCFGPSLRDRRDHHEWRKNSGSRFSNECGLLKSDFRRRRSPLN